VSVSIRLQGTNVTAVSLTLRRRWRNFHPNGFILRDVSLRDAPQDEVSG
jgi:hypothetical protein